MKNLFTLILILTISSLSYAQRYDNAVGLRGGGIGSGITFQHKINEKLMGEAILSLRTSYQSLGVLVEFYTPIEINIPGQFYWFVGGGIHVAHYRDYYSTYYWAATEPRNTYLFGLDPIGGVMYEFKDLPLSASFDYKPEINFSTIAQSYWFAPTVSARYEF